MHDFIYLGSPDQDLILIKIKQIIIKLLFIFFQLNIFVWTDFITNIFSERKIENNIKVNIRRQIKFDIDVF